MNGYPIEKFADQASLTNAGLPLDDAHVGSTLLHQFINSRKLGVLGGTTHEGKVFQRMKDEG